VGSTVTLAAVNYSLLSRRRKDSLWGKLRCWIYDGAIVPLTSKWYQEVLYNIPPGSRVLDVGIGTGAALVANANLVREKHITLVGVDYDAAYIEKCQVLIDSHSLSDHVSATCCSFYGYKDEERFDHIYFSGSFMILPDPQGALRHALGLLKDTTNNGRLYFTQTFELSRNVFLEKLKPALAYLTSIDFGRVTYVEELEEVFQEVGVVVVSSTQIHDGNASRGRESRLLVVARRSF
jgi:SAM-dependent methyltransferase